MILWGWLNSILAEPKTFSAKEGERAEKEGIPRKEKIRVATIQLGVFQAVALKKDGGICPLEVKHESELQRDVRDSPPPVYA